MFKKKKTYVILAIIILIVGGYYYQKSKKPTVEYSTAEAVKGNLTRTVSVSATLKAPNQADLSFKSAGEINFINYEVGANVKKGALIAKIKNGTLDESRSQAVAEVNIQKRTYYLKRDKHNTYNKQEREIQKAAVKKAEEALSIIDEQISQTYLYSPIAGTVVERNYDPGENVSANATVISVAGEGELELSANVPESDIVSIKNGQKAVVTFDALSTDDKLEAEVFKIDPASTVIQDVVYYKVKMKLAKPDTRLKVGMSADADVNTAEKNNVVTVPMRAVKTDGNRKYVEILNTDNTIKQANVETGLAGDEGMVEITSGLSGGEKVVTLTKNP